MVVDRLARCPRGRDRPQGHRSAPRHRPCGSDSTDRTWRHVPRRPPRRVAPPMSLPAPSPDDLARLLPPEVDLARPARHASARPVWLGMVWSRLGRGDLAWQFWDRVKARGVQPWLAAERGRVLRELGLHEEAERLEWPALAAAEDPVDRAMLRVSLVADAVGRGDVDGAVRRLEAAREAVADAGRLAPRRTPAAAAHVGVGGGGVGDRDRAVRRRAAAPRRPRAPSRCRPTSHTGPASTAPRPCCSAGWWPTTCACSTSPRPRRPRCWPGPCSSRGPTTGRPTASTGRDATGPRSSRPRPMPPRSARRRRRSDSPPRDHAPPPASPRDQPRRRCGHDEQHDDQGHQRDRRPPPDGAAGAGRGLDRRRRRRP